MDGFESVPNAQRLEALERANYTRIARAELKRRLRSGEMTAAEVILRRPPGTDTMTVGTLLLSQRGWGPRRSSTVLRRLSLPETKTLGSLTERQRVMLAAALVQHEQNRMKKLLPIREGAMASGGRL